MSNQYLFYYFKISVQDFSILRANIYTTGEYILIKQTYLMQV